MTIAVREPAEVKVTKVEARVWLDTAAPGSRLTYYVGFLCRSRAGENREATPDSVEIERMAEFLWNASEKSGQVCLTQRKLGEFQYEYIATKRLLPV